MKIISILLFTIIFSLSLPPYLYAQACNPACGAGETCIAGECISGPTGLKSEFTQPGALAFMISRTVAFIYPILGIVAFILFLVSGFQFLTSKGDPKALDSAKNRLTYVVIGMIIIAMAHGLTLIATNMLGISTQ